MKPTSACPSAISDRLLQTYQMHMHLSMPNICVQRTFLEAHQCVPQRHLLPELVGGQRLVQVPRVHEADHLPLRWGGGRSRWVLAAGDLCRGHARHLKPAGGRQAGGLCGHLIAWQVDVVVEVCCAVTSLRGRSMR